MPLPPITDADRYGSALYYRGFWSPDGWVLYMTGRAETAPLDLEAADELGRRWSPSLKITFWPRGIGQGGGQAYYWPEANKTVDPKSTFPCVVGMTSTSDGGHHGYFAEWTKIGNLWRCDARLFPDGLGVDIFGRPLLMPFWDGKSYPPWPRRGRGRPPVP
jgi:hypothetical protein